eukprot:scaffold38552_cov30-Tisochrysis_lutea.AAC.7
MEGGDGRLFVSSAPPALAPLAPPILLPDAFEEPLSMAAPRSLCVPGGAERSRRRESSCPFSKFNRAKRLHRRRISGSKSLDHPHTV